MPLHKLPEHIIPRPGHPFQKTLDLLGAEIGICWNGRLSQWELHRRQLTARGMLFEFIQRLPRGAEPGEWLINQLKARDSRYAGAKEAWQNVKRELDQSEAEANAASEKAMEARLTDINEHIAKDYLPVWQDVADPHWNTRQYKEWDKEPVHYFVTNPKREAIRAEAKRAG